METAKYLATSKAIPAVTSAGRHALLAVFSSGVIPSTAGKKRQSGILSSS